MRSLLPLLPALAAAYQPFLLPALTTHQPNGNPAGQVNYYRIAFTVTSPISNSSAYCNEFWGDNSWLQLEPYSVGVPTGEWIVCDSSEDNLNDKASNFSFQLFPYFSIGNFSLEVREALEGGESISGFTHITNQTDAYTCDINPIQVPYQQHAQGDCSIADGKGPFKIDASLD